MTKLGPGIKGKGTKSNYPKHENLHLEPAASKSFVINNIKYIYIYFL